MKTAVSDSSAPTTEERELCWAAVISPPVAHNSLKLGRKEMVSPVLGAFVQCCQIQMLKRWDMGSSNGNRLGDLWTCVVPHVHVQFTCLGFHGGSNLLLVSNER